MKYIKLFENFNKKLRPNSEWVTFLSAKKFNNPKSKRFLYHGTTISPEKFNLRDDYDWEDSNVWSGDLPDGYLFLSTHLGEASTYGQYVIPCELEKYDHKFFNVDSNNPSKVFDMDYGIDLYMPDEHFDFWGKFEESGKTNLIIKGYDKKWTIISPVYNVIPRIDLAMDFYNYKDINEINAYKETIQHSYNSIEELSNHLREIVIWGINGEYGDTGCREDFDQPEEEIIECVLGDFNHTMNSDYPEGFKNMKDIVPIHRLICIKPEEKLNTDDLGYYWFAREEQYKNPKFYQMLDYINPRYGNVILIKGSTHISNIDFPHSIWHRSTQYLENEIRVIDPTKVKFLSQELIAPMNNYFT